MAMRSLGYMPSEVELAIIMQRLDMDGELLHKVTHLGACTEHAHTQMQTHKVISERLFIIFSISVMFVYICCA